LGKDGRGSKDKGKKWMKRDRKSSLDGEQWVAPQEKEEKLRGVKNRDKKIVMVMSIIQKKKKEARYSENKKLSLLVTVLELFLWCLIVFWALERRVLSLLSDSSMR
jgi:hypothetical protein